MSDYNYENLSEREAADILITCWPLVYLLHTRGYNAELDSTNQLKLASFKQLGLAGWFENSDIHRMVGMVRSDISLLSIAVDYQLKKRLKELHEVGNG